MNYTQLKQLIQDYTQNYESTFVADIPTIVEQAEQRIYNSVQFPSLRKNMTGSITQYNQYLATPNDFLAPYSLAVYTYASTTATGSSGSLTITVSNTSGIMVGQLAAGTGIAPSAIVTSIAGTTITLSLINIGAVSGTVTFQGPFQYLLNKDVNYMREAYNYPNSYGTPKYYALFGPTVSGGSITNELTFILGPTPDIAYNAELHYYYYPVSIADTTNNPSGTSWLGDNFDTVLLYGSLVEAYTFMKGESDMFTIYNQKYTEALALAKRLGDGMERRDAYRSGQTRIDVS